MLFKIVCILMCHGGIVNFIKGEFDLQDKPHNSRSQEFGNDDL